ncbi:MAG: COP23 domain-containing protein [Hormoscilla sp.]
MIAKPRRPWTGKVLAIALTLSGIIACSTQESQVKYSISTSFRCMPYEDSLGTFAKRGNAISEFPMIAWNTTEFGSDYSPEKRCNIVSQRLTRAVADNGEMLSNLELTTGMLNDYPVVCFVTNRSEKCKDSNLLFTLKQENAKNPQKVLAKMTLFGHGKAGKDEIIDEEIYPESISLEELVDRHLPQDSGW